MCSEHKIDVLLTLLLLSLIFLQNENVASAMTFSLIVVCRNLCIFCPCQ